MDKLKIKTQNSQENSETRPATEVGGLKRGCSGVAALPVILLISAIILEIVAAAAFLAFSFSSGSFGTLLATEALFGSRTGADDAFYRVIKNNYRSAYNLTVDAGTHAVAVDITVEKDPVDLGACSISWGCRYRVRSTGTVMFRSRRTETILAVDPVNREIRRESFKEIEI